MQATRAFYPEGFYIFESTASANSNYIENLSEAKILRRYMFYYLRDYVDIQEYVISRHGFQLAVRLKTSQEIVAAHEKHHPQKAYPEEALWKIISNRMRLFLSTYVRCVNRLRGRRGVLVRERYKRYFFEELAEALLHLEKMREREVRMGQGLRKYRGIKRHYKIDDEKVRGSIILSSKKLKLGAKKKENCQLKWYLPELVVQKWLDLTLNLQFLNNSRKNSNYSYKNPPDP